MKIYSPGRRLSLFSLLLLAASWAAQSQEQSLASMLPAIRSQALIIDITARVVEQNQEAALWNNSSSKITLPGRPVGLKLVGANVVVAVQFTPYRQRGGSNILVAQGQIWIDIPNEGVRYQTTIESIPVDFGEAVYFLPLGDSEVPGSARIEILVTLRRYEQEASGGEENSPIPPEGISETLPEE